MKKKSLRLKVSIPGRFMRDDRGVFLCNPIIAKHWSLSTALIDSSATEIEQLHR